MSVVSINAERVKLMDPSEVAKLHPENVMISRIDLDVIAHFGNTVSVAIVIDNGRKLTGYNNTLSAGIVIRDLLEMFGKDQEDGVMLSSVTNFPARIFWSDSSFQAKIVGIGHFTNDSKVVLLKDLLGR